MRQNFKKYQCITIVKYIRIAYMQNKSGSISIQDNYSEIYIMPERKITLLYYQI